MKINFLKPVDTIDDFYGISLISENPKEKQLIKKMTNGNLVFKTSERQSASLVKKQVIVTIEIVNVM